MAAPRTRKSQVQFNKGELSPKLDARVDTEVYQGGCRQLKNFLPMVQGGITKRRGFEYVAESKFATLNRPARVLRFQFSQADAMLLEFGHRYIRFFTRANGQVMDPGDPSEPYELSSPYTAAEAFAIQVAQVNDVMYITHPLHAPRKLTRLDIDDWTLSTVVLDLPPFLDENVSDITLTISNASVGSGRTLTASDDLFENPEHVGSYWRIGHRRETDTVEIAITADGTSSTIRTLGDWTVNTYGTWAATLLVQVSLNNGSTWETVRRYTSKADANFADSGEQTGEEALYRLVVEDWVSGAGSPAPRAVFTAQSGIVYGLVRVTAVSSSTVATVTVIDALYSTDPTNRWSEGAFSELRGYPTSLCFFQQRLWFGGTSFQPQTFWGSVIDDYENFSTGTGDADGLNFTLASEERNQIVWMVGQKKLVLGTTGGIWAAYGDELEAAITATKPPLVLKQQQYPAAYQRALLVNGAILFIQSSGRKLRELVFDGGQGVYAAGDLNAISDQISKGGLVTPSFQQNRDSMFWACTGFGKLVSLAYEKEQNVLAWAHHDTAGVFESVDTIKGPVDDEVWVCVRRLINGTWKRFIERMSGYFNPSTDYNRVQVETSCTSVTHTNPAIITQPQSLIVNEGDEAIFSVVAVGATGYQWRKDGVNISGETADTLSIKEAELSDEADYSVVITTEGSPLTSDDASLTVLENPEGEAVFEEYTISIAGTPTDVDFLVGGLESTMGGLGWELTLLTVTVDGGSAEGPFWVHFNGSGSTPSVPSGYTPVFMTGLFDGSSYFDGWLIYETP
jgi:hypothetical protein